MRAQRERDVMALAKAPLVSPDGFVERLVMFWTDHFTVSAVSQELGLAIPDFIAEAIRPHVAGNFGEMLRAATLHPAMLVYLDQDRSIGPNSPAGTGRERGLNENLARELLELHSVGVHAAYGQEDVLQLAELLTGLQVTPEGMRFNRQWAEPGPETVLGKDYGGAAPQLADIEMALADLALHPATATHLSRKLATHFISQTPPEALVEQMASAYIAANGDLSALYETMLGSDDAWAPELQKVKQPLHFTVSAARAIGLSHMGKNEREFRIGVVRPLVSMGQDLFRPKGPDGWPEAADHWITPAMLTARIEWAAALARKFTTTLDPRVFVEEALGGLASSELIFAAAGAEARWEGNAVVLASPEFNRY